jgi:hypothetical protein
MGAGWLGGNFKQILESYLKDSDIASIIKQGAAGVPRSNTPNVDVTLTTVAGLINTAPLSFPALAPIPYDYALRVFIPLFAATATAPTTLTLYESVNAGPSVPIGSVDLAKLWTTSSQLPGNSIAIVQYNLYFLAAQFPFQTSPFTFDFAAKVDANTAVITAACIPFYSLSLTPTAS